MQTASYICTFEHLGERLNDGRLALVNDGTNQHYTLQVAVDDEQLSFLRYQALPPLLADLVDVAVAVHMTDRLAKSTGNLPRHLLLRLPLRQKEVLDTPTIHEKLRDILYWFTEDHWSFEFLPYTSIGRPAQIRPPLPWEQASHAQTDVVLWSGGLDALAGVYQLLQQNEASRYLLFGTGSNTIISHTQQLIAQKLEVLFPRRTQLVQLPFRLQDKQKQLKKSSMARSRGFVFMVLGAVCASQQGLDRLFVCENGIGAINLPFRKSEVGLDHARSVHPISLSAVSELLSLVLGQPFTITNPFLFQTKAQICKDLLQNDEARQAVFATISCDRRHRKYPTQCGYCSSCLLRRQAIAAHGIKDETGYQILEKTHRPRKQNDEVPYAAMREQVTAMQAIFNDPDPWLRLSQRYRTLIDIVDQATEPHIVMQKLLFLYQTYVQEWNTATHILGAEFLE